MKSEDITYHGPGREAAYDLKGPTIRVGLVVPLRGPQKAAGEAIVAAARMALEDDARENPGANGIGLELAIGDESGPSWGHVGETLLRLVEEDRAIAVVTSADGATAHLSEQVGNRLGVATLTLASDKTTTQIDLPWIFRFGPSDELQAQILAENIYRRGGFTRVLLVTEADHDGRLGRAEFLGAARRLGTPSPVTVSLDLLQPDVGGTLKALRAESPQCLVLWTRPNTAKEVLRAMRHAGLFLPSFLSQKAAQGSAELGGNARDSGPAGDDSGTVWTVAPAEPPSPLAESFARRYQAATGTLPSSVAAEAYDAVSLIARAVRETGPNRARVRDWLATVKDVRGVTGPISFDRQGNDLAGVRLVRLR